MAKKLVVSGFGTSAANGTYYEAGTWDSRTYYFNGAYFIFYAAPYSGYWLKPYLEDSEAHGAAYYYTTDNPSSPELGTWSQNIGSTPIGTVVASDTNIIYNRAGLVADNFTYSQLPTTNNGTATNWSCQGDTGQTYHTFLRWTLPSAPVGAGAITALKLNAYLFSRGTNSQSGDIEIHQMSGAGAAGWTETGSTHNNYDATHAWSTGGGDFSATVIHKSTTPSANNWQSWDLQGGSATNPITPSWATDLNLTMKFETENTSSSPDDYANWYSREYTGDISKLPYIQITFDIASSNRSLGGGVSSGAGFHFAEKLKAWIPKPMIFVPDMSFLVPKKPVLLLPKLQLI